MVINQSTAIETFAPLMQIDKIMSIRNVEVRRLMLEAAGTDRIFESSGANVIHRDVDEQGNPRTLLHLACADAEGGVLAACRVVCPSTGRVYHLLVDPLAKTCQSAIDGTFEIVGEFVARHT